MNLFDIWASGSCPQDHQKKLEKDGELQHRTSVSVEHITDILEFYLQNTYFLFQGKFFEHIGGAAIESPISPIVASLYMEEFWDQGHKISYASTEDMEKTCEWHICGTRSIR